MLGNKKNRKALPEKKPLSHGWIVVPSKTYPDRVYFHNTITKCSTWENPCEPSRKKSSEQSSSESSSSSSLKIRSISRKSSITHSKRLKSKAQTSLITSKANDEIEDYDDQYFDNVPVSPPELAHSSVFSPPGSPDFVFSPKASLTDGPKPKSILSDEKKELWLHFASSPEKSSMRKSLALGDFEKPSTSKSHQQNNKISDVGKRTPRSHNLLPAESSKKEIPSNAKKKRKKKRSQSANEAQKKKTSDKTINNVSFKRRDKTPAQTRLLKLRQQNTEILKKIATSAAFRNQDSDSAKFSSDSNDDNFSNEYLKRAEIRSNELMRKTKDNSVTDFSEEMDWEPSNEELDVQNINEFRQRRDKANNISSDIFFGLASDSTSSLPSHSNSWLLVLDTNIFVSCLSFIKEIRDTNIPGLGYPILYIPWRVLQELDHLKDSKIDNQLHWNVRRAITYLNENFKSKHPRCFGQSFQDFAKMVDVEASAPDDEILQTCIQLKKLHPDKKLTLLTNDRNLESKAIVSGLKVYSKERFQKQYLSSDSVPDVLNRDSNSSEVEATQIDNAVCAMKTILKNTIPPVVEEEMKLAFQEDWVKMAYRKPPWTLKDSMDCLVKHWRSVFFVVFSRDILPDLEKLSEKLFKREIVTLEDVKETINTAQRLLTGMRKTLKKKRLYKVFLDASTTKLSGLLEEISRKRLPQVEPESPDQSHCASLQFSLLPAANGSLFHSAQMPEALLTDNDVDEAKNLFRDIWDSLRSFCCSVSDMVNFSSTNNSISIPEIRLKLSQVLNELEELVLTVDKMFEINLKDVHEAHPLVLHLSSFLIKANPSMAPDLRNRLPKCLAAFFSDPEGRLLLSGSMVDFREFSRDLVKATEYFERNYPTF